MPKTPHDGIAVLIFIVSFFICALFLKLAKREITETQRAALMPKFDATSLTPAQQILLLLKWVEWIGIAGMLISFAAYYYAPIIPSLALIGVVLGVVVADYRLIRRHVVVSAVEKYSTARKGYLIASMLTYSIGIIVAVVVRTLG